MVRVKRRYVLFELIPNDPSVDVLSVSEKDIIDSIRQTIETLYGDFGLGCVLQTLQLKRFNQMTRTGVLATKRSNHLIVLTAMPFIRRVKRLDCVFRTLHKSGTIRGCLKALRIHHNKQIIDFTKTLNSLKKIKNIEKGVKDIESSLKGSLRQQLVSQTDVQKNTN